MEAKNRIIVDLDIVGQDKITPFLWALALHVGCFRAGPRSIILGGSRIVEIICSYSEVFHDGKLDDDPDSVGNAAAIIADLKVKMFSVHASAGIEAMKAAVVNKGQSLVFAITVLSSLKAKHIFDLGYPSKWPCVESWERYAIYDLDRFSYLWRLIEQMAKCAKCAGCDGIICSPRELKIFGRRKEFDGLLKIATNVYPKWAVSEGQKEQIITPAEATEAGADYLVIGSPIVNPPPEIGTPADAAKKIAEEIASVL